MSEEELIALVQRIRTASGCMVDLDDLLGKFEANVKDSSASRLIFEASAEGMLSPTEVVRRAGPKQE